MGNLTGGGGSRFWLQSKQSKAPWRPSRGRLAAGPTCSGGGGGSELLHRGLFHIKPPFFAAVLSGSQFRSSPVGLHATSHPKKPPGGGTRTLGAKDVGAAAQTGLPPNRGWTGASLLELSG